MKKKRYLALLSIHDCNSNLNVQLNDYTDNKVKPIFVKVQNLMITCISRKQQFFQKFRCTIVFS